MCYQVCVTLTELMMIMCGLSIMYFNLAHLCMMQLGKSKYHKSHHFDVCNDTSMMVGEAKPGIGGEPLPGQKVKPRNSKFPKGEGSNLPAWVAFDRQVNKYMQTCYTCTNAYRMHMHALITAFYFQ